MNLWLKFKRNLQRFTEFKVPSLSHSKTTPLNSGGLISSLLSFTLMLSLCSSLYQTTFHLYYSNLMYSPHLQISSCELSSCSKKKMYPHIPTLAKLVSFLLLYPLRWYWKLVNICVLSLVNLAPASVHADAEAPPPWWPAPGLRKAFPE